ncbi:signal peptidase II [Arthrobacter sp. Soc17.1.1.1]|uniref:signal peptidase II n=1 Tax=Arthrobacter sp. Soc17.1.1.1 TaxID=3121277 RepID=UPI002FE4B1B9
MSEDKRPAPRALGARNKARLWMLVGSLALVGSDLAVKAIVELQLSRGQTIEGGLVDLRLHFNQGVAFSFGADLPPVVILLGTAILILGLSWFLLSTAGTLGRLGLVGGAMVLGGALGNFLDRLAGDGVVDYLHVGWFATFNLADVFITVGAALLILATLLTGSGSKPPISSPP